jgi:hypothetical protein
MKHETTRALYNYWLGRRRGAGVRPTAVRAADLTAILPALFLIDLENVEAPAFRFRFCGASISTRYGRDLTDESFLSLWNATDAASLKRDLRAGAFRSTGMVAGVMAETVGGGVIAHEMLLLPLSGENGAAGAIGSMQRIGGHDEANRVRARIVAQSLRSIRFLPDAGSGFGEKRFAAPVAARAVIVETPRRYGHLTVVPGGRPAAETPHLLTDI